MSVEAGGPAVEGKAMDGQGKKQGTVLKNTLILVGGQIGGVPLSILMSAAMGRYLGAEDFGYIYLAGTLTGFGFLLVEWGHGGVLAADIARDRSRAGSLLGSTLWWRTIGTLIATAALSLVSVLLGYSRLFSIVLLLVSIQAFVTTVRNACQDVARGFERLDVTAYAQFAAQLLGVVIVIPTLLLGGKLLPVVIAQLVCATIVAVGVWRSVRSLDLGVVASDRATVKNLFTQGASFLVFGIVLALQPNIDAIFLSKLSSATVLGWQAAAQRLMGLINMPASQLGAALYPTLSRLYVEDRKEYNVTVTRALQGTTLLAMPATVGCALYRGVGVQLFGDQSFRPVEQNLLVLSSLVFLLYFSMPISVAILAAGRQRPFAIVQSGCLVVSLVLDPLLIPWFERRYHNGGLGVCVAGAVSEIVVLVGGVVLLPRGAINRSLAVSVFKAVVAGAAMTGAGIALGRLTPYVAAPISLAVYFGCLWVIGGIAPDQIAAVRGLVTRKLRRRTAS
jgi:O-antigen/teichoic acid export membrane protein